MLAYDTSGPYTDPSVQTDIQFGGCSASADMDRKPRRLRRINAQRISFS
ncbi:hypothetical protein [Teredinibacter franksiae]|nr:hypothetical protein [Teredinibacter franksiae]